MNSSTRETKHLDALRQAQRHVSDDAARHMGEAARLLQLAEDLDQRIRKTIEGPK